MRPWQPGPRRQRDVTRGGGAAARGAEDRCAGGAAGRRLLCGAPLAHSTRRLSLRGSRARHGRAREPRVARPLPPAAGGAPAPDTPAGRAAGSSRRGGASSSTSSANHLLNFSFPTQPPDGGSRAAARHGSSGAHPRRGDPATTARPPVSKEAFLQANFRFLVLHDSARRVPGNGCRADADACVEWADVVSVENAAQTPPSCPICLDDELTAPQITPCGHIFCFPCIARHLIPKASLVGDATASGAPPPLFASRACPMCSAHVRLSELRRATHCPVTLPREGEVAEFTLLARAKGSLVPAPLACEEGATTAAMAAKKADGRWPMASPSDTRLCRWAKLTLTTDEAAVAAADLAALEAAAARAISGGEGAINPMGLAALSAAMDALKARAAAWTERRLELRESVTVGAMSVRPASFAHSPGSAGSSGGGGAALALARMGAGRTPCAADSAWDASDREGESPKPRLGLSLPPGAVVDSEESLLDGVAGLGDAQAPLPPAPRGSEASSPERWVFYLSSDGGAVTLHPLSVRALLAQHGSYDCFPPLLRAPVVSCERGAMSPDSRRRFRFLAHLPLRTPYLLAELDLAHCVSPQAWASTASERASRALKRAADERALEREARRGAAAEEARLAALALARAAAAGPTQAELTAMPPLAQAVPQDAQFVAPAPPAGISFARVADLGYASGLHAPPICGVEAAVAGPAARPQWGPRAVGRGSPAASAPGAAQPRGWFGSEAEAEPPGGRKGKGKTLLFSTAQRRY